MCKTLSFTMTVQGDIYYFNKEQRLSLCDNNPNDYNPDSHTSINDFFGLNDDKTDKFELRLKTMQIVKDKTTTGKADDNQSKLQRFINRKSVEWCKELILASHRVWIAGDCPEWLAPEGRLYLPKATIVYCDNNHLTTLNLPEATRVSCYNNSLTTLTLPKATKVSCSDNHLTTLTLPKATTVYCYNNALTTLNLPKATYVDCNNNSLTTLNLPEATKVSCSDNHLTTLTLPKATEVYCSINTLTTLTLPKATEVYCDNNPLTTINVPKHCFVYK